MAVHQLFNLLLVALVLSDDARRAVCLRLLHTLQEAWLTRARAELCGRSRAEERTLWFWCLTGRSE